MLLLRRVIFAFFALLYLVVCPAVILYALGYLVKPGTDPRFVKTGLISIATIPSGANVYLGNRRYTQLTPSVLRNLIPGSYPVRLAMKGYQGWSRTVDVKPSRATVLDSVLLVPWQWPQKTLFEDSFDDLVPFPRREFLLLKRGTRLEGAVLYDAKTSKVWPLIDKGAPLADARILAQTVMPGGLALLMRLHAYDRELILWVEARPRKEPQVVDVTKLFLSKPQRVLWEASDKHHLFSLKSGVLDRIDLSEQSVAPSLIEGVRGFGLLHRRLYVLKDDGTVLRTDMENKAPEILHRNDAVSRLLEAETAKVTLYPISDDLILFLNERGQLMANQFPFVLVDEGVVGLSYNLQPEQLLVWTRTRLGVLDLTTETSNNTDGKRSLRDVHWTDVAAQSIKYAWWVHEGRNILFQDQERIRLARIETPQPAEIYDITRVKRDSQSWYNESTGTLFFIEPKQGSLRALAVLSRPESPSLASPDLSESSEIEEKQP